MVAAIHDLKKKDISDIFGPTDVILHPPIGAVDDRSCGDPLERWGIQRSFHYENLEKQYL